VKWVNVAVFTVTPASETVVREYRGHQQADANSKFQSDADVLARAGYVPSTQSWAAGQYGAGAFVVALLLLFVLVGILVFIYMLIVKPDGTLTVTYTRKPPPPTTHPNAATLATTSVADRLRSLQEAKEAGLISDDEYSAARARVLEDI
jgi:hypothetical protein